MKSPPRWLAYVVMLGSLVLSLIVGAGMVSAAEGEFLYYDFNEGSGTIAVDEWGTNNGTITGATYSSTTPSYNISGSGFPYALSLDGTNDFVDSNTGLPNVNGPAFAVSVWVNHDGIYSNNEILWRTDGTNIVQVYLGDSTVDQWIFNVAGSSGSESIRTDPSLFNPGSWTHIVATRDTNTFSIYINGELANSSTFSPGTVTPSNNLLVGATITGSAYLGGLIDDFQVYNISLNASQVRTLYNYGTFDGVISNFTIAATDSYTGSSLTNFSAVIDGTTYNTTNGFIITDILTNSSSLHDITITSSENGGYFSRNYTDYNVSSPLPASLHQAEITFYAENRVSGEEVVNFTASTSSNGGNASDTAQNPRLNLTAADDYTFTFTKAGYYASTLSGINVSALDGSNHTFSVYDHKLTLSLNITGETNTGQNFSVDVYDKQGWGFHERLNTTDGTITANLTAGNYIVWLNDTEHVLRSYNVTLNSTVNATNYTLQAANINQLIISFFDLSTLDLISGQQVNVTLVGDTRTYTDSTSNGTVTLDLLNPDTYEVTASAANYSDARIYVTLNNDNATADMYLDPAGLTDITFTVQSTLGDELGNATVTITQNVNGTHVTVQQAKTDAFGQAIVALDQTETYFITVTHPDYATFEGSLNPLQTSYTVSLEPAESEEYESIFDLAGLDGPTFAYNASTDTLTVTLDAVSGDGAISYFGFSTTYNNAAYGQNVTGSPGGGTAQATINPANASIQDEVTVLYWLKVNGREEFSNTVTYYISEATPGNTTIRGGLFQEPSDGLSDAGKAILGTLIVLLVLGVTMAITGRLAAGAIAGAVVVGGLSIGTYALFAPTYGVMTAVLCIIIAIGDGV